MGIWAAKAGFFPKETRPDPPSLSITVWGKHFPNPLGVAAGFDKNAEIAEQLLSLGFGFVEVGSITPLPQPGNPKPRCFRLESHNAVINRYGFNSHGVDSAEHRLAAFRARKVEKGEEFPIGLLGVNLGKNKTSPDAAADYSAGVLKLAKYADYLVINISSPNTPGLRALQSRAELENLIKAVQQARKQAAHLDSSATPSSEAPRSAARPTSWWFFSKNESTSTADDIKHASHPPLLVKIAPDLTEQDKIDIAAASLSLRVDGLIVSNTTIERPGSIPLHPHGHETGGLSGEPLFEPSTAVLRDMYRLTKGKIPIIGVGGVSSGRDAYEKIKAGASLVEVYTAFSYKGPSLVPKIKKELAALLHADGYKSVADAVGADHRTQNTQP